jgi:methylenetetrahydrofolate reductase (NADPH)
MRPYRSTPISRNLASAACIELIPLKGIESAFEAIPNGSTVTLTCSAKFGIERTLRYTELARAAGLRVVPHLAARQVRDIAELRGFVRRITDAGVEDLYVIGGDVPEPLGGYSSSVELLRDLAGLEHGLESIGVACYPEGHPSIPDTVLIEELRAKQELATYMVSQLCFDVSALLDWLPRMRSLGISLPLRLGIAGPVNSRKLAELSLRIGVGPSLRFVGKQHGLIRNLLFGTSYRPERLLDELSRDSRFTDLGIERLHVFTFNQVEATAIWLRRVAEVSPA